MKSLRLRFFLITWPLVVIAVAAVAMTFSRWTRVELEQLVDAAAAPVDPDVYKELADSLSGWLGDAEVGGLPGEPATPKGEASGGQDGGDMLPRGSDGTTRDGRRTGPVAAQKLGGAAGLGVRLDAVVAQLSIQDDVVVLDPDGAIIASTDATLRIDTSGQSDAPARVDGSRAPGVAVSGTAPAVDAELEAAAVPEGDAAPRADAAADRSTDIRTTPEIGAMREGGAASNTDAAVGARAVALVREGRTDDLVREESLVVGGLALRSPDGVRLGSVYVVPTAAAPDDVDARLPVLRADARRTLWIAALLASAVAAAAAVILAGPMVRQIERLAGVAAAVEGGSLDVRVPVGSDDEIGELERSFNAMAVALEAADTHKRNVASDAAHELRTPLTNLVGMLEAIEDGLLQADRDTIGSLRREASLLTELVDELQELSLAESGQLVLNIEPLDATSEAVAALRACRARAGDHTLVEPEAAPDVLVLADRRRLRQILGNLLDNALTYTPSGGTIGIDVTSRKGRVAFTVHDTGPGIPEDDLPLIWERFHRVDPSRARDTGGMGLGLAVVRRLVEAMDGSVSVVNDPRQGAAFTVELPLRV